MIYRSRPDLPTYTPGTHEEGEGFIRLNTNESPFPPGPGVLEAVTAEVGRLNFYNDPDCTLLCRALAEREGIPVDSVLPGNGSDQILYLAISAFSGPEHPLVIPEITYDYYELFAAALGVPLRRIPLREDWSVAPMDYAHCGGMVIFPNPNAPTGIEAPVGEIRSLCRANADHVVLVDEAYYGFGAGTALPLIRECENLLIVRTFSKSGSLAGARLGFAMGAPSLIRELARMRNAVDLYGVSRMAQAAGVAACRGRAYYEDNARRIAASREWTRAKLEALGFTVLPSRGNFLFARPPRGNAREIRSRLEQQRILVRYFDREPVREYLRITIGTAQEMQTLIDALPGCGL